MEEDLGVGCNLDWQTNFCTYESACSYIDMLVHSCLYSKIGTYWLQFVTVWFKNITLLLLWIKLPLQGKLWWKLMSWNVMLSSSIPTTHTFCEALWVVAARGSRYWQCGRLHQSSHSCSIFSNAYRAFKSVGQWRVGTSKEQKSYVRLAMSAWISMNPPPPWLNKSRKCQWISSSQRRRDTTAWQWGLTGPFNSMTWSDILERLSRLTLL